MEPVLGRRVIDRDREVPRMLLAWAMVELAGSLHSTGLEELEAGTASMGAVLESSVGAVAQSRFGWVPGMCLV